MATKNSGKRKKETPPDSQVSPIDANESTEETPELAFMEKLKEQDVKDVGEFQDSAGFGRWAGNARWARGRPAG